MIIRPFFVPGIAHSSYLVAGSSACVVIDPARDTGRYIAAAQEEGLAITHILLTHLHADFIAGHRDLAEETGAAIAAPKTAGCAFPHIPLAEGDEVWCEDICFSVIETPGHTPEHICFVATDTSRSDRPVALFSGDTLFVGDVGRPDLFPGRAEELASALYDSLHEKILALPAECEVYPAHGQGSLCGRAIAARRSSTIGYEKHANYALRIRKKAAFVKALTSGMPPAPDHFARCSAVNRAGPALLSHLPAPVATGPEVFRAETGSSDAVLLDVRCYPAFSGLHIPGSWHIDLAGNFATQAGWVLPPDRDIFLVAESREQAGEATVQLRRVGLDRVVGFLAGGVRSWAIHGYPVGTVPVVSADEAGALVRKDRAVLLDVRSPDEWEAGHAERSVHIPWHDLRSRFTELDRDHRYIVMCRGGQRASIAASILLMHGFSHVMNLAGGYAAYSRAGGR